MKIKNLYWHACTTDDGTEYVRLSENNWAQWMGESLEVVNNVETNTDLETQFLLERVQRLRKVLDESPDKTVYPVAGQEWTDTETGRGYVYRDGKWVGFGDWDTEEKTQVKETEKVNV